MKPNPHQENRKVEEELDSTLAALRAYRRRDANFEGAIKSFVDSEAQFGADDPVEGRPDID